MQFLVHGNHMDQGSSTIGLGGAGALYVYEIIRWWRKRRTIRSPFISQTAPGRYVSGTPMSLSSSLSKETYQDTFTIADSPDAHPITGLVVGSGSTNRSYGGMCAINRCCY